MRFEQLFKDTLKKSNTVAELRQELIHLRISGVDKQTLLSELESYRGKTGTSAEEDVILEVMDFLVGNCSSHMRID